MNILKKVVVLVVLDFNQTPKQLPKATYSILIKLQRGNFFTGLLNIKEKISRLRQSCIKYNCGGILHKPTASLLVQLSPLNHRVV